MLTLRASDSQDSLSVDKADSCQPMVDSDTKMSSVDHKDMYDPARASSKTFKSKVKSAHSKHWGKFPVFFRHEALRYLTSLWPGIVMVDTEASPYNCMGYITNRCLECGLQRVSSSPYTPVQLKGIVHMVSAKPWTDRI